MGVRGLTTFIARNNKTYLKEYILYDCNVVIDGHSLAAQIYQSGDCHSAFGGDYDKYAWLIKKVFLNLKKCNITPYVLFDGSHERRKFRTICHRHRCKVKGAYFLHPGNQTDLQIFPALFRDTFKEVMAEMNIQFTVCEFEADEEIAALARHLQCPVISFDSDFYIYNVLYIPFPTLNLRPIKLPEGGYGLCCQIYTVQNFLKQFGGLKLDMLPLFAALLGNDYVDKRVFINFYHHLKVPNKSKRLQNDTQRTIQGLLDWLRNESLDSAIEKIVERLKVGHRGRVSRIFRNVCESYTTVSCKSLKYLQIESHKKLQDTINVIEQYGGEIVQEIEYVDSSDEENDSSSTTSAESQDMCNDSEPENDSLLPDWVTRGLRSGQLVQPYINLYTNCLYVGNCQVEDYDSEDSFFCAIKILRYSFDLLTDFSELDITLLGRVGQHSRKIPITSDHSLKVDEKCVDKIPFIDDRGSVIDYFKIFLNKTLPAIDLDLVKTLPDNCQIFMLALIWWVKETSPTIAHVYTLFLTYIMMDVIDEKIGNSRGESFVKKHSEKIEQIKNKAKENGNTSLIILSKTQVTNEDCLVAACNLLKNFEVDATIKKRPRMFDICRIHSFAQFQNCLQQFSYLNRLTGSTFPSIILHKVYSGTFTYNIFSRVYNREDSFSYVVNYLQGAESVISLFKSICDVFSTISATLNLVMSPSTGNGRKHRKKSKKIKTVFTDVPEVERMRDESENEFDDQNNKFNILFLAGL